MNGTWLQEASQESGGNSEREDKLVGIMCMCVYVCVQGFVSVNPAPAVCVSAFYAVVVSVSSAE